MRWIIRLGNGPPPTEKLATEKLAIVPRVREQPSKATVHRSIDNPSKNYKVAAWEPKTQKLSYEHSVKLSAAVGAFSFAAVFNWK